MLCGRHGSFFPCDGCLPSIHGGCGDNAHINTVWDESGRMGKDTLKTTYLPGPKAKEISSFIISVSCLYHHIILVNFQRCQQKILVEKISDLDLSVSFVPILRCFLQRGVLVRLVLAACVCPLQ